MATKSTKDKPSEEKPNKKTSSKAKAKSNKSAFTKIKDFCLDEKTQQIFGIFLMAFSIFLIVAFVSYLQTWKQDDALVSNSVWNVLIGNNTVQNTMGRFGVLFSTLFIKKLFGLASMLFTPLFFLYGFRLTFGKTLFRINIGKASRFGLLSILWISVICGFFAYNKQEPTLNLLGGVVGCELGELLVSYLGRYGTLVLLVGVPLVALIAWSGFSLRLKKEEDDIPELQEEQPEESKQEDEDENEEPKPEKEKKKKEPFFDRVAKWFVREPKEQLNEDDAEGENADEEQKGEPTPEPTGNCIIITPQEEEPQEEKEEDDDDYLVIDRTDKTNGKARRPEVADDEITIRVEPTETEPQEEKEPENNQPEEPEEEEIKVHIEEPEPETEPLSESNANTNEEAGAVVYTTAKNMAEAGGFAAANTPQNETATVATPVKTEPKEEQSQVNEKIKDDKEFQDILNLSKKRSAEEVITGPTKIGDMVVSVAAEEAQATNLGEMQLKEYGLDTKYDPRADLSSYRFPTLDLLKDYAPSTEKPTIDELENKQAAIRTTLKNFGIEIDSIKASIGPTVTLYEIIPAPGVRISKIKNLEDDIALSLAALGIRIIAPMPGKGTIGIEAPNSNPETVPMKAVLSSEKFVSSRMELPIALGKTISNETYVADLTKMPHLLVAGATGQGKSVGINAIITSLLYKKHPAELKFVLVDPKKVELSIYSKIERHYLAKLPDSEDAVITDVKKVVRTLNSLCVEMDQRYDLLKDADCRNIKEYNAKFINRKLNPKEGHRFLPYIVLVVDEFADLIMTAGREVETPIARLAQLARAIGIHLIIATQRPSVNIITGPIKANFPARVAFKVFSKVDSRTILDTGGADQLIGRGDMLLSIGNDLIRIQCAFIDTPEVAALCDMIGEQRGYPDAMYLPDVPDENESESGRRDLDPNERDEYFVEAARLLVATQQGSTSMLQRKMKLGYNRAGRLMDQLEDAGIVGPSVGSKAREVLIKDENTLNIYLQENGLL